MEAGYDDHNDSQVRQYLIYFSKCIRDGMVRDIRLLYETAFAELTEKYFKDKLWPKAELVAEVVQKADRPGETQDLTLFLTLYKEMYFRYLYSVRQRGPILRDRVASYENYNELFVAILNNEAPVPIDLPHVWAWDIIDEFIYQFQSFCLYKVNPAKRHNEENDDFSYDDAWNLYPVSNILYQLVEVSQIDAQLEAMARGSDALLELQQNLNDFAQSKLYQKLGYYSLIGLLRLHVLLGDYTQALKVVSHIRLHPSGMYNNVPSCLVTLHYLLAYVHLMKRDYVEATRLIVNCLLYIQRSKATSAKSTYRYDVISKTQDQLYHLLAICQVLQPTRVDEAVMSLLVEKHGERMQRMRRGELHDFEAAFSAGCPKFIMPLAPLEPDVNNSKEAVRAQLQVFMDEMLQLVVVPNVRGYLKLYSSMPSAKLAQFMDISPTKLVSQMLCFKHKLCNVSDTLPGDGSGQADSEPADESTVAVADLDFYVDKDMVHIADTKVDRRVGEYFLKHISKLSELERQLKRVTPPAAIRAAQTSAEQKRA